jgi:hypothetical protein
MRILVWCDTTYQMSYQSPSCQVQRLSCWKSGTQCWQSREPPADWQLKHPHHHWAIVYARATMWACHCVCMIYVCVCEHLCVCAERERERETSKWWVSMIHVFSTLYPPTHVHVRYIPYLDPVWISLLNSSSSPLLILRGLRLQWNTYIQVHTYSNGNLQARN